jgi:hypothetical protein
MGFANAFVVASGLTQYKAQGKIGKYNQAVNNRNAKVLENQAIQLEQKAEFASTGTSLLTMNQGSKIV